jgi:hypothetical protein
MCCVVRLSRRHEGSTPLTPPSRPRAWARSVLAVMKLTHRASDRGLEGAGAGEVRPVTG